MAKRTWARKAELVALWDQADRAGKRCLAGSEGQTYAGLGSSITRWKKDPRSKSADKAPRRLCKVCNELKTLDQFELTQYQTVCIACTGLNQRPDPDLFIALRRRLTQFTPDEQDALIAEYRAILTTQSDRDYARFELAKKYGVSLGTLQSSVFRWENIRRHANAREAATGANSDLVTDWLFTMFEDLALAEDIQNSILAHRVRYKRGNHAS